MRLISGLLAIVLTGLLASSAWSQGQDDTQPRTILVYDVSNSMWGQIDGVSKVEIAREVIGDIVADWDPAAELGLVAYGHRREGDCTDIETVIPVGPVDAAAFSATVNALVPRGRTPLTDAVRAAAQDLQYTDRPSTVILVSDGIESCEADPCALAAELEATGLGFTAHVIGFDVSRIADQRELSCLAENTGGLYLTAENAEELTAAFRTVAAPPPPMLLIEAAESEAGPALSDPEIAWTLVDLGTERTLVDGQRSAVVEIDLDGGRYFARAELGALAGSAEFSYAGDDDVVERVVLQPLLSLDGPEFVAALDAFEVRWTGPDNPGDFIALARTGTAATAFDAYARTSAGSPAALTAPATPGEDYELRYVAAAASTVLAAAPIRVIAPEATLDAPDTVYVGRQVTVAWTGPGAEGDYISLAPLDSQDSTPGTYAYTRQGSPLQILAPDIPGAYQLRYFSAEIAAVIQRRPIEVLPLPAALEAPPAVPAGSSVDVTWTGPDNQNDFIALVPAGADERENGNYSYTRDGSPLAVRAPDTPGAHELRYVSGQSRTILATLPITVTEVTAALEAPPAVPAGSSVDVTWTGPDNQNDFIALVPAGADERENGNYSYTRDGSPLAVRAPDTPGAHELRYVSGQSRTILATLPITVTEVTAALEAPPAVPAGSSVDVTWTGPDNRNDFIALVPAGADERENGNYSYTRDGSPLAVRAPDTPGAHELRYVSGQSRTILATLPITVTEVTAALEAPPAVPAGSSVDVTWTGPDNQNDFIALVPAGADERENGNYSYTRDGSPLAVRAPDTPGAHELRYVSGQSRTILATLPITVTEVTAALEAPPAVPAGSSVDVTWTGPDNQNDFIALVPAGADERENGNYSYTRDGSPLAVRAPDTPGAHELRYVSGQSRTILATLPITVTEVTAALEAPPAVPAGSSVDVTWTGPDNRNDFIALVPAGADERENGNYSYTRDGSPLAVRAPDTPGAHELRYVSGQSRTILATLPITVTEVTAALEAPPAVPAGSSVDVTWTGPDNQNDFIALVPAGADERENGNYSYTRDGSPLAVRAPDTPGAHELRYVSGQSRTILATLPIMVD